MKCQSCGYDYPGNLARCSKCGRSAPGKNLRNDARLIEFPRRPAANPSPAAEAPIPAWRAELSERVRAVRAKRAAQTDVPVPTRRAEPPAAEEPAFTPAPRKNDTIVQAALMRAQRANEQAARAAVPRLDASRPAGAPHNGLALDREATARALEPAHEVQPQELPAPPPRVTATAAAAPAPAPATPKPPITLVAEPAASDAISNAGEIGSVAVTPLDEIEPRDYLADEISRVDRGLRSEFAHNESPSVFMHAVIQAVDLFAILMSVAPFLALMEISNANFTAESTRTTVGLIALLVSFFYLSVTQWLCGKTFGMMLTNTRLVDATTFEEASGLRVLLRTFGYYIAAAPLLLGILWLLFDRRRRGWHDYISGTLVARDF